MFNNSDQKTQEQLIEDGEQLDLLEIIKNEIDKQIDNTSGFLESDLKWKEKQKKLIKERREIDGKIAEIQKRRKEILEPQIQALEKRRTTKKYKQQLDAITKMNLEIDDGTSILEMDNTEDVEGFARENLTDLELKKYSIESFVDSKTGTRIFVDTKTNINYIRYLFSKLSHVEPLSLMS